MNRLWDGVAGLPRRSLFAGAGRFGLALAASGVLTTAFGQGVALAQADCVGGCDCYGPCACNGAQTCCTGCDCGGSPVPCCCNAPSNDCAYSHYTQNNGYCGCFIGC